MHERFQDSKFEMEKFPFSQSNVHSKSNFLNLKSECNNLLNDLDKLPMQTIKTKAGGNRGETRSINIPAQCHGSI